jgi:hypothetical protein
VTRTSEPALFVVLFRQPLSYTREPSKLRHIGEDSYIIPHVHFVTDIAVIFYILFKTLSRWSLCSFEGVVRSNGEPRPPMLLK